MDHVFLNKVLESTGANHLKEVEVIQSLWSGYGKIVRYSLKGADVQSVVVKHVKLPEGSNHPRGWNTDYSHQRKIKSYKVETAWYQYYSELCDSSCRIPRCFAIEHQGEEVLMVLEDLDSSGYPERKSSVKWLEIAACLKWLANFHASFLEKAPNGLWKTGTYWHLETRPDELEQLIDSNLKNAAGEIDRILNSCKYQTLVHGDAKLANFCFSKDGEEVAAVDFQYVGGGCGMKDVAYFVGSCLYEDDCERLENKLLDTYFDYLREAIKQKQNHIDFDALENEWRKMYPYAWTDFHRFLKGWSPGHWKINSYSERVAGEVVAELRG